MNNYEYKLAKRKLALAGFKERKKRESEIERYKYKAAKIKEAKEKRLKEKWKNQKAWLRKKQELKAREMANAMIGRRIVKFKKLTQKEAEARAILRSKGIFKY